MSGRSGSMTMQSIRRSPRIASASSPLATEVTRMSSLPISSRTRSRCAGSRPTTSRSLTGRSTKSLIVSSELLERLARLDRLGEDAQRPEAQGAVAVLLGRDDADRDVPGGQVVLEPLEDPPAVDVGQVDVEGDRVGHVLAGHRQRRGAERGDQPLEALLAGRVEQEPGEGQVVLDDQQDAVAGLDRCRGRRRPR